MDMNKTETRKTIRAAQRLTQDTNGDFRDVYDFVEELVTEHYPRGITMMTPEEAAEQIHVEDKDKFIEFCKKKSITGFISRSEARRINAFAQESE